MEVKRKRSAISRQQSAIADMGHLSRVSVIANLTCAQGSPRFGGEGKYRKTPIDTVLYFSSEGEMAALFGSLVAIEDLKTIDIESKSGVHRAIYAFLWKR